MELLLFQTGPPPIPIGVDPLVYWLGGAVITALVSAVVALWRLSVAEGKRKDSIIDRQDARITQLIEQVGRLTGVQDRTVTVVERRERGHQ